MTSNYILDTTIFMHDSCIVTEKEKQTLPKRYKDLKHVSAVYHEAAITALADISKEHKNCLQNLPSSPQTRELIDTLYEVFLVESTYRTKFFEELIVPALNDQEFLIDLLGKSRMIMHGAHPVDTASIIQIIHTTAEQLSLESGENYTEPTTQLICNLIQHSPSLEYLREVIEVSQCKSFTMVNSKALIEHYALAELTELLSEHPQTSSLLLSTNRKQIIFRANKLREELIQLEDTFDDDVGYGYTKIGRDISSLIKANLNQISILLENAQKHTPKELRNNFNLIQKTITIEFTYFVRLNPSVEESEKNIYLPWNAEELELLAETFSTVDSSLLCNLDLTAVLKVTDQYAAENSLAGVWEAEKQLILLHSSMKPNNSLLENQEALHYLKMTFLHEFAHVIQIGTYDEINDRIHGPNELSIDFDSFLSLSG